MIFLVCLKNQRFFRDLTNAITYFKINNKVSKILGNSQKKKKKMLLNDTFYGFEKPKNVRVGKYMVFFFNLFC